MHTYAHMHTRTHMHCTHMHCTHMHTRTTHAYARTHIQYRDPLTLCSRASLSSISSSVITCTGDSGEDQHSKTHTNSHTMSLSEPTATTRVDYVSHSCAGEATLACHKDHFSCQTVLTSDDIAHDRCMCVGPPVHTQMYFPWVHTLLLTPFLFPRPCSPTTSLSSLLLPILLAPTDMHLPSPTLTHKHTYSRSHIFHSTIAMTHVAYCLLHRMP